MKNSMLGLPQLKPKILRRKKSAPKGARKKNETKFTRGSKLLTLISRTMKAQSKGGARGDVRKKLSVNPIGKRNQTGNREGKGLTEKSLFMKAFVMEIMMRQGLIDRGVIGTGLTTMSHDIASKR